VNLLLFCKEKKNELRQSKNVVSLSSASSFVEIRGEIKKKVNRKGMESRVTGIDVSTTRYLEGRACLSGSPGE
jgi:hypothetical protein